MGSPCTIKIYQADRWAAQRTLKAAEAAVAALEQKYSRFLPDNFFASINRAAKAGTSVSIDEECAALLDYAQTCHETSEGLFDITSGVLRAAWDFKSGQLPSQEAIDDLLPRIGWQHVSWTRSEIRFGRPGMEIDFGGIVKEYAADTVAGLLEQRRVHHGLVDLGGDIRVIGPHADGQPWSVALRHGRNSDDIMGAIDLAKGAVASSGDYERCIVIDGVRYAHILNPRTGWPVHGLAAVSVVAPHCVVAGSCATIAMLKGLEGLAWIKEAGIHAMVMDNQGIRHDCLDND